MLDRNFIINGLDEIKHYKGEQMFHNDIFIRGIAESALALLEKREAEILQLEAELDILRNIYKQENPYRQAVKWDETAEYWNKPKPEPNAK